jgi:prepilin-type processing-associated H-X9-DG protein
MIRFTCECGKPLQAKEEYAGQMTRCPDCGRELPIPGGSTAIQPAAAAPPRERPRAAADEDYEEAPPPMTGTSGKATASLVLGLMSFLCTLFTGIPAIILGIWGLVDINRNQGRLGGSGLAIGGLITGAIGTIGVLPLLLIGLLIPAVQKVREAANRVQCTNNLKQIGIAFHNYHDVHGQFPPAVVYDATGKPLYSWRVLLLPYLEQDALYRQFKLDEPWDSPHNKPLSMVMLKVYMDPSHPPEPGMTTYQVIRGKGTLFEADPQNGLVPLKDGKGRFQAKPIIKMADITDGTSNTFLVVETDQAVPWAAPMDLDFDPNGPLPKFGTAHAGGFNAAFADGSVRFLNNVAPQTLRALITRNGGEVIPPF